jgi:hypothetical protein
MAKQMHTKVVDGVRYEIQLNKSEDGFDYRVRQHGQTQVLATGWTAGTAGEAADEAVNHLKMNKS